MYPVGRRGRDVYSSFDPLRLLLENVICRSSASVGLFPSWSYCRINANHNG